jgi:hypothetical protein
MDIITRNKIFAKYLPFDVKFTGLKFGSEVEDVGLILTLEDLLDKNKWQYIKLHLREYNSINNLEATPTIRKSFDMVVRFPSIENKDILSDVLDSYYHKYHIDNRNLIAHGYAVEIGD